MSKILVIDDERSIRNTLKDILEYDADAKIIFVSVDRSIENDVMTLGAKKFISKPFQMQLLIDNIREIAEQ